MDIAFRTTKLGRVFNDWSLLVRKYGDKRAKIIAQRLQELHAASTLNEMRFIPGPRCHELKGKRADQLSVDLDGPYRLVFAVANNPVPQKADGGLDWSKVNAITILEVEDTHG